MRKLSLSALAVLALALPGAAAAQDNATMTVTANVLGPINVAVQQVLDFGDVLPGVPQDIPSTDVANSGIFAVTGNAGSEVDVAFTTLPAVLDDGGLNTMTVTWSAGYGDLATAQGTAFTAGSGATTTLTGAGELFVFLGGSFTPAVDQATGAYTADVTLTVSYTGN